MYGRDDLWPEPVIEIGQAVVLILGLCFFGMVLHLANGFGYRA